MEELTTTEIDNILNTVIGGISIKEMTAITFMQFVLTKLNGQPRNDYRVIELSTLCNNPPMRRIMPNEEKIELLIKLKSLGINV